MNSLLLGGNGFIGSHLVDRLLIEGHAVRIIDKHNELYRKPLPGVEYLLGDFGNRGLIMEALEGIDIVYHLVSTTLPKTSNDDPIFDVQSNLVESIMLFRACSLRKIKKVVFVSSGGTVYGRPESLPVDEDHPTNPMCSYGINKLTIEKYLFLFNQLYELNSVIVRPSNVYGTRQNPGSIQGAVAVFLGKIAGNQTIEIWGDGEVVRDYLFVEDFVDGVYRAAMHGKPFNIFNLASNRGYSINNLLSIIESVVKRDLRVKYKTTRPFDVSKIYLDISRAKKELLWNPVTSLENGIRKTWEFIQGIAP